MAGSVRVGIVMGSSSDAEVMAPAGEVLERFGGDQTGTGAGHKEAAWGDELHGKDVEVVVLLEPLGLELDVAAVDELGRVAQDEVPGLAILLHLADPAEGVGVDELQPGLVEVGVPLGLRDRRLVQVHAGNLRGSTGDLGVEGKAAGVAAQVEHACVLRKARDPAAVVALVAEEAGLVATTIKAAAPAIQRFMNAPEKMMIREFFPVDAQLKITRTRYSCVAADS